MKLEIWAPELNRSWRVGIHKFASEPFVLGGPINRTAFTAWVEQCLAPTLKGDIVIFDNPGSSHKGKPARNAIRDLGAHLFFLPPYSPDLDRDDVRQTQDPAAQIRRA
ncbi:transposase [Ensifer sp. P24N7]|uniref:transposase n=1 Tax=Sinorhizobium sp. P24N7 TaxID=3348358 RepID=UPI0035F4DB2C